LVAVSAVAALVVAVPPGASAAPADEALVAAAAPRIASGWIVHWRLTRGVKVVTNHAELVKDVSFFWYRATRKSRVLDQEPGAQPSQAQLRAAIQAVQGLGVRAYVSVTDTGFDATSMARLLGDRQRRGRLVTNLVTTAKEVGAGGVDIDFEAMNFGSVGKDRTAVKKRFPRFLAQLQKRLHASGMKLSVALPPRTGVRDNAWEVYDYRLIAPTVDRARVLAYDYHVPSGRPGPVAPLPWVNHVARYAGDTLGRKASLGLPAYGYNWHVRRLSGTCPAGATSPTTGTPGAFRGVAAREGVTPTYRRSLASYTYSYRRVFSDGARSCRVKRTVWFEDARSVKDKLPLLRRHGLGSVALWTLGGERPATWQVLASYAARR
jgi:spore germination protein YaaH